MHVQSGPQPTAASCRVDGKWARNPRLTVNATRRRLSRHSWPSTGTRYVFNHTGKRTGKRRGRPRASLWTVQPSRDLPPRPVVKNRTMQLGGMIRYRARRRSRQTYFGIENLER